MNSASHSDSIEGFALAGGFELALSGDLIVAALPALFSKDAAEGALAFAQQREPQWQGR